MTTAVTSQEHLIGLLLGAEEDWPTAFEALARRLGVIRDGQGVSHSLRTERVSIEPFNLRDRPGRSSSSTGSRTGTTTRASG